MTDENVLCLKRTSLPQSWLQQRLSLPMTWNAFLEATGCLKAEFQPRNSVENNPDYKQLIPYILLFDKQGRLAFYQRRGSEKRLLGCYSVGIGGHIRDDDFTGSRFSWNELQAKALQRELEEELPGFSMKSPPSFLGLINEEMTKVGHSHLGLVFTIKNIDSAKIRVGKELETLQWAEPGFLRQAKHFRFEIWSELALQLID